MATLYGKATGGNFNGANWSTTGSGGGDSVTPTAADDCILETGSGNFTINSGSVCRSLDCTGGTGSYAGTLTHTAAVTFNIGDATAGAGNRALRLAAGMTYTLGSATTSIVNFISTSSTTQTITSAGKTVLVTLAGAGGKWQLADTLTTGSGNVTLTTGTFETNNQNITTNTFSSTGTGVRTLTMGSSAITCTGGGVSWSCATTTNMTITANTAVLTMSGAAAAFRGPNNWNGMSVVMSGSGAMSFDQAGTTTLANFTRTGTAVKTDSLFLNQALTCTGLCTLTGNSVTNRLLVNSNTPGTARTITAATVSLTNVDFMDITGAGAATWTGTSTGNALGNTNITFDTPATQTHTASAGGNWSDVTKWTSRVPLPQDDVVVDANTTGTLTADMPRLGANIDFTGFAGTYAQGAITASVFGSLTWATSMTIGTLLGPLTLTGRGSHTVTSAGKSFSASWSITAPGGTYTLQDALVNSGTSGITITDGTFTTNNFNVTCNVFTATSGRVCVIGGGTSIFSLTSSTASWNTTGSLTTLDMDEATLVFATAGTGSKVYAPGNGNRNVGTVTYAVANSPGTLIAGPSAANSTTIGTLNIGPGRNLNLTSTSTTFITNTFNVNGAVNGYVYLPGVSGNYISAPDSAALSITGDIDLRIRASVPDWTPAGAFILMAKRLTAGNQRSWYLRVDATTGLLRLMLSDDGTVETTIPSSVAPTLTDNTTYWIRATWRASDGRVQFFTADGALTNPSAGDFTQVGTDRTIAVASIFDSTAAVEVGSTDNGVAVSFIPSVGKFYRAQLRNGIDGTVVYDADFVGKTVGANSFTESSSNAATVTINGTLAQAGDGRVSLVSSTPGSQATLSKSTGVVSCNYLSIQDSAATGGAKWYAGANSVNVSNNTGWIFAASNPDNPNANRFFGVFE